MSDMALCLRNLEWRVFTEFGWIIGLSAVYTEYFLGEFHLNIVKPGCALKLVI
jgi:hypothetical protein